MFVFRNLAIGGIEINPSKIGEINGDPRVGHVGPGHSGLASCGMSDHISADVSGGNSQRSQAANLEVCKILTDTATMFKNIQHRRSNGCGADVEFEFLVNSASQIPCAFQQRPGGRKARIGVLRQFRRARNVERIMNILARVQHRRFATLGNELPGILPARTNITRRQLKLADIGFTLRIDPQTLMRFLYAEPGDMISKEIEVFAEGGRSGIEANVPVAAGLAGRVAWMQMGQIMAERNQLVVTILGDVLNAVDHSVRSD